MQKAKRLIGIAGFLVLALFASTSVTQAVLFDVEDGWDETDNPYADGDDYITISFGSDIDSRYVFEASSSADTYCLELSSTTDRSHSYTIGSTYIPGLPIWAGTTVTDGGHDWTVQTIGGTNSRCRFYVWKDKSCDDVWLQSIASYTTAGCAPDHSGDLLEGDTDTYTVGADDIEITCVAAGAHNYVKCQAPSFGDLDDCRDDSRDDIASGDDFNMYEFCLGSDSSGTDTTSNCDVANVAEGWELNVLRSSTLAAWKQDIWLRGIPNATFTLWEYDFCGTASFDRDLVATINLLQFSALGTQCTEDYGYQAVGTVTGYRPWFGTGETNNNLTYIYGENECSIGTVCQEQTPAEEEDDPDENACFIEPGATCYDGKRNQDEAEIDYGGACGNCSGEGKNNDVYWAVAIASQRSGFFSATNPFDSEQYCGEAEDSANFLVVFIIISSIILLLLIFFVFLTVAVLLGFAILPFIKTLFNRKKKKE